MSESNCYKCLDEIQSGHIEVVTELRNDCPMYKLGQCKYMSAEKSFNQKIQDINIRLFPNKVIEFFQSNKLMSLIIVFVLSISIITLVSIEHSELANVNKTISYAESLLNSAYEYEKVGMKNEAFNLISEQYTIFSDSFSTNELQTFQKYLLTLGTDVETFKPSELYNNNKEKKSLDICRVNGFVSHISEDSLVGNQILLSDSSEFDKLSVAVNVYDDISNIKIGDELVLIGVPTFVDIGTPISIYGWVQP